jgi:hypothetical protein
MERLTKLESEAGMACNIIDRASTSPHLLDSPTPSPNNRNSKAPPGKSPAVLSHGKET